MHEILISFTLIAPDSCTCQSQLSNWDCMYLVTYLVIFFIPLIKLWFASFKMQLKKKSRLAKKIVVINQYYYKILNNDNNNKYY